MSDMRVRRATPPRRAMPSGGGHTVLGLAGPTAPPVRRPRPHLAALGLEIEGPVPLPGEYRPGTAGFRYWATAEALERVAALWRAAVETPWSWAHGSRLRVALSGGAAAETVCERGRLVLGGGASPASVQRALGHAVLDALCPDLWDAAAAEVTAFHAGFADCAALLAMLEVPGGEEGIALAWQAAGTAFGRAFAEVLAVLARTRPVAGRTVDARLAALRGARLLAAAVRRAAVAPDYIAQVASEMVLAAAVQEGPLVALQLRALFARHGMLARSPVLEGYDPHEAEDGTELPLPRHAMPWVAMDAAVLGLDRPLLVCPASQPPLLAGTADVPAPMVAARECTEALFARGLVEKPRIGRLQRRAPGTHALATHRLVDDGRVLRLVRERFVVG